MNAAGPAQTLTLTSYKGAKQHQEYFYNVADTNMNKNKRTV